jgi:hypothetical protein
VPINTDITANTTWTRDKVYILNRLIFVRNNATLTIEPGTIVRGITNTQSELNLEPGALIVTKSGRLVANATPDDPIVFTSIDDPHVPGGSTTIPASFQNSQGTTLTLGNQYGTLNYQTTATGALNNAFAHSQRWGGVVMLGDAFVAQNTAGLSFPYGPGDIGLDPAGATNDPDNIGQDYIEGLDPIDLGDTARGGFSAYGGVNAAHDGGVLRFASIRHGGFVIGDANEINSLTTGGLGSNTVIEFVESTINEDDGFEFFGGSHDTRFLFANYIYDDSFDCDEGWGGTHQFWFAVQPNTAVQPQSGGNNVDEIFEFDGPEPYNITSVPNPLLQVFNLTALALSGKAIEPDEAIRLDLRNSLLQGGGTKGKTTSGKEALTFEINNVHHDGTFSGLTASSAVTTGTTNNEVVNIANRYVLVDPRLKPDSTAADLGGADPSNTVGVDGVGYSAFQRDNTFLNGWTHLSALGKAPTNNITRPVLTLGVVGSNPTVTFPVAVSPIAPARTVIYVVERSTDGVNWVPVTSVTDGGAGDEVSSGAGFITVKDSATSLTAGVPVQYRAYAL